MDQRPNPEKESAAMEREVDRQNGIVEPVRLSIKDPAIADWEFRTLAILLDVIENPPGWPCSRSLTPDEKARMTAYLAARYAPTAGADHE